ncbi:MAG: protein kinase [Anaerolineae bacterium]|nr:protein kinase [Anaerolineae bacterium]
MDPLIGQRLGQYEIVELLGTGGMAKVYRSRQVSMDRGVAIKVIKQDLMETEGFAERFRREAKIIASLSHPHILKVFDFGTEGNLAYIVMELLNGGSLNKLVAVRGPLHSDVVGRVLSQICQALDYAHAQGIVHRDLKPENVLLDSTENAFLTDFGIAKLLTEVGTTLTQTGTVMGTPAYMAPELWAGEAASPRTDIYALGVMLYNMVAGTTPFAGETTFRIMYMHVNEQLPPPSSKNANISPAIDTVISKALAKNPDQRYRTAGELAQAFAQAARGESPAPLSAGWDGITNPITAASPAQQTPSKVPTPAKVPTPSKLPTQPSAANRTPQRAFDRTEIAPTPEQGVKPLAATDYAIERTNQPAAKRGTGMLALGIVGALVVAGIAFVVISALTGQRNSDATQTAAALTTIQAALMGTSTSEAEALVFANTEMARTKIALLQVTATPTATNTDVPTDVPSDTPIPTATETPAATSTPSDTATLTDTPRPTETATLTPSATDTEIPPTLTPTVDIALLVEQTLAPQRTATANAIHIQQTVDALLTKAAGDFQSTQTAQAEIRRKADFDASLTAIAQQVAATQTALARPTITFTPSVAPTPIPVGVLPTQSTTCPGFRQSRLAVGMTGRVTAGRPNRLRSSPSLSSTQVGTIPGGGEFIVINGPICADGYAWWQVNYNGEIGWTVEGQGTEYFTEPVNAVVGVPTVPPVNANGQCPGALPSQLIPGQLARVIPEFGDNFLYSYPAPSRLYPDISDQLGYIPRGDVAVVISGPVCNVGYVWWQVNYNGKIGWTVEMKVGGTYWMEPL